MGGGGPKEFFKTLPHATGAGSPPASRRRGSEAVRRGQHASAGSPRLLGPLVRRPSGALTLPDCFRGEQLGSKYTRRDFLTSGKKKKKRQRRAHDSDPPAHFLKELQTPQNSSSMRSNGVKTIWLHGFVSILSIMWHLKNTLETPPADPPTPAAIHAAV